MTAPHEENPTAQVSTIITTMGRPELVDAVTSALNQTMPSQVIVTIADPSRTTEVLRILASNDLHNSVQLAKPSRRLNGSEARNFGATRADGNYVAYLDDDDWWHPAKLSHQVSAIRSSAADISTGAAWMLRSKEPAFRDRRMVPHIDPTTRNSLEYVLRRPRVRYGRYLIQTSTLLIARAALRKLAWKETMPRHQDWDLYLRACELDLQRTHCQQAVTFVRQNSDSSVSKSQNIHASLTWAASLNADPHSLNDFLLTIPISQSIAARDFTTAKSAIKLLRPGRVSPPVALHLGHALYKGCRAR